MKYRVTRYLNKRKEPVENTSDKSNVLGQVEEGFEFESVETRVNDRGTWYKDRDNHWYWGGGVVEVESFDKTQIYGDTEYPEWMRILRLPEIWKITTGKGVGVAVIDTGICDIADLPYNKTTYKYSSLCTSINDSNSHGSHCAGLISARNSSSFKNGVAPDSNLFVYKIANDNQLPPDDASKREFAKAIDWCVTQEAIKVISISWDSTIKDQSVIDDIQKSVDKATKAGKIIIVARANISRPNTDSSKGYPSCCNNVISVGIIPVLNKFHNFKKYKDILVPGAYINSYNHTGKIMQDSGTSMSTAIMAGIVCLILEKKGLHLGVMDIKKIISNISDQKISEGERVNFINGTSLYNYLNNKV